MIRYTTLFVLFLCAISSLSAQTLDDFTQKLAEKDSVYNSSVLVFEKGVPEGVRSTDTESEFNVYRVNIFFDNGQNARVKAQSEQEKFSELYPEIPSYLVYENPYFKITVGNCTSSQEAIILLGRLRKDFPKAFLARELVAIKTLLD